jgi:hypothetical protein
MKDIEIPKTNMTSVTYLKFPNMATEEVKITEIHIIMDWTQLKN